SFLAARVAVHSGVSLQDFLRHRLARQLAELPVPPTRLPLTLSLGPEGSIDCQAASAPPIRSPWLESFLRAEGSPAARADIQNLEGRLVGLAARIEEQRSRVRTAAGHLEEMTRATEVTDPNDDAQARHAGRPPTPLPTGLAMQLFALALLLSEAWQLCMPCLGSLGIRVSDLSFEAHRNPIGLAAGVFFALGISSCLFVLAHLFLTRILLVFQSEPPRAKRVLAVLSSVLPAAIITALCWTMVRTGSRPSDGRAIAFVISLAIPLTAASLIRFAAPLEKTRAEALARARVWDQEQYRSFARLSQRAMALSRAKEDLDRLEAEHASSVRRLRAMQQRLAHAERTAADAADAEEHQLLVVVNRTAAALELDRYEYLRQAAARGVTIRSEAPAPATPPAQVRTEVPERNLGLAG
ncbi:MAG TPA: hypothetical protein VMK12_06690, partial [Anaeromyxobacteraceae bacterium]|nr:hypothetical protein [Anaeromyxobacteraceae bacterium]